MNERWSGQPKRDEEPLPEFRWNEATRSYQRIYDTEHEIPVTEDTSSPARSRYEPIVIRRSEEDLDVRGEVGVPNYTEVRPLEHPRRELELPRERPRTVYVPEYEEKREVRRSAPQSPRKAPIYATPRRRDEEAVDTGRRSFLGATAAVAGTVGLGMLVSHAVKSSEEKRTLKTIEYGEGETPPEAPRFEAEIEGYEAFAALPYNQALFVDEFNRPIGAPVPLDDFITHRRTENGAMEQYKVSPGPKDEIGILTEGLAGEWLAYMRVQLKEKYPDIAVDLKNGIPRVLSANAKFRSTFYDSDDAQMVAAIARGEIASYMDIVKYHGGQTTPETGGLTIQEYIEQNIVFEDFDEETKRGLPSLVQSELRRIIPGLCAQESNFKNDAVSKSGARGIFQFMPATWAEYDDTKGGIVEGVKSLEKQVRSAGAFFSDLYYQVQHHAGEETMNHLRAVYDEETIQRDILVPLMINAYNAGGALIGEALRIYVARYEFEKNPVPGKDLFIAIADFAKESEDGKYLARYGDEAREYVTRIYANANIIHQTA